MHFQAKSALLESSPATPTDAFLAWQSMITWNHFIGKTPRDSKRVLRIRDDKIVILQQYPDILCLEVLFNFLQILDFPSKRMVRVKWGIELDIFSCERTSFGRNPQFIQSIPQGDGGAICLEKWIVTLVNNLAL
jgi:hypothetical protein